jgi:hypothetical protein
VNQHPGRTVEQVERGIMDPEKFSETVSLQRYLPGPELAGLIEFFWVVSYELPASLVHSQQLITYPAVNLSIAHGQVGDDGRRRPLEARVTGVTRDLYTRRIAGTGWGVAAKSTPGGFGAFVAGPVAAPTDRVVPLGEVLPLDEVALKVDAVRDIARVAGQTRPLVLTCRADDYEEIIREGGVLVGRAAVIELRQLPVNGVTHQNRRHQSEPSLSSP